MTNNKYSDETIDRIHRHIVDRSTGRLLVRPHLNNDWAIALVGERGDCKTIGGVKITLKDFMFHGYKCFSNMNIKFTVIVPDDHPGCKLFGIPGGEVVYESEYLDKKALFQLDERYRNCVIFADEINLELAEARRSSSNVNLNLNKVGQELRKLNAALVYTVINEMWVDNRIRDLTDIFIKTQDTALDPNALLNKRKPGIQARWSLYPMSRKFNGYTHTAGLSPLGPYFIYVRDMWTAFDTLEMQASESLKYGSFMRESKIKSNIDVQSSDTAREHFDKRAFLDDIATEIFNRGELFIPADEYYNHSEVIRSGMAKHELSAYLNRTYNIKAIKKTINGERKTYYQVPEEPKPIMVED